MKLVSLRPALGIFIAVLGFAWPAQARVPLAGKVMLFGNLGYSAYGMEKANEFVDERNSLIRLTGGTELDHITGGLTGGGGLGVWVADFLALGVEGNYLEAGSKGNIGFLGNEVRVSLPGAEAVGFIRFGIPIGDRLLLAVNAAAGNYWTKGQIESFNNRVDYEGYHFGGKTSAGLELFVVPYALSLAADAGYRFATVTQIKEKDGQVLKTLNGDDVQVDYSGFFAMGSIRVYF